MSYENVEIAAKYNHKVEDEETGVSDELFSTEFAFTKDLGKDLQDALSKLAASTGEDGEVIGAKEAGRIIHQYYMLHAKVLGQNASRSKMGEVCKDITNADNAPEQAEINAVLEPFMANWNPTFKTSAKKTVTEKMSDVMKDLNAEQRKAVLAELAKMQAAKDAE